MTRWGRVPVLASCNTSMKSISVPTMVKLGDSISCSMASRKRLCVEAIKIVFLADSGLPPTSAGALVTSSTRRA